MLLEQSESDAEKHKWQLISKSHSLRVISFSSRHDRPNHSVPVLSSRLTGMVETDQGHKCFMVRLHRCPELIKADINVVLRREWEDNTACISPPRLTRQMGYNLLSSSHIAEDLKWWVAMRIRCGRSSSQYNINLFCGEWLGTSSLTIPYKTSRRRKQYIDKTA